MTSRWRKRQFWRSTSGTAIFSQKDTLEHSERDTLLENDFRPPRVVQGRDRHALLCEQEKIGMQHCLLPHKSITFTHLRDHLTSTRLASVVLSSQQSPTTFFKTSHAPCLSFLSQASHRCHLFLRRLSSFRSLNNLVPVSPFRRHFCYRYTAPLHSHGISDRIHSAAAPATSSSVSNNIAGLPVDSAPFSLSRIRRILSEPL